MSYPRTPGYTVNHLIKKLQALKDAWHGRKRVVVDKESFTHNCESDGVTMLELSGVGIEWVGNADGDGGTKYNKDGTESGSNVVVLVGDSRSLNGEPVPRGGAA